MSGTNEPDDDLSPEDQAALAEYEQANTAAAKPPKPPSRAAALTRLFLQTPEMREHRETVDSINAKLDTGDTVPVRIDVPREFLRLAEFLERLRAADAGNAVQPTEAVLAEMLTDAFHDQLHWLTVEPARFPYYRDLWNRFCDAQGAPEEKIPDTDGGSTS